ncbi:Ldi domain-containing protein [Favolaschia claudopus]|uniref:Ldi domain-containing protein n=1 Tax=Favolaschia claudopus TaxID=2862362 RepID=A0AAW0EGB7_9AGAR
MSASSNLPKTLPPDFLDHAEPLSAAQAGHLRHFHNLATAPLGVWPHMGSQIPGEEWFDSLRYQLATMAYAASVAHYHRLPALRSVFKSLLESLITKMLDKEVWGYWYLTSQSGILLDPDLKELRKPWADPVVTENIMYSGHLLLMISLHAMLFDDDKYDAPDALVFKWAPVFWGMGPETFTYNRTTLQKAILKEMERENWIGVCCEPNAVFVVCNQFPLIAIRYNDIRTGTNLIEGVLEKYTAAWDAKNGYLQDDGLFVHCFQVKQRQRIPERSLSFTAWACAFMNSWNSEEVHALYPRQAVGFMNTKPHDGRVNVHSAPLAQAIRTLIREEDADPNAPATLSKAREMSKDVPKFFPAEFGYVSQWVSEVGDAATLKGLMLHADTHLKPTWDKGGLFYPRNDELEDAEGNWTAMQAYTGNGAIPYARLNVHDGQKIMWEKPWPRGHSLVAPYVDGVDLSSGVDFLRGKWDAGLGAMIVTLKTWDGSSQPVSPIFRNLPEGKYGVYINRTLTKTQSVTAGDNIIITVDVEGRDLDIVVLKENIKRQL